MKILNLVIDEDIYGTANSFVVSIPQNELIKAIEAAEKESEIERIQMLFNIKRAIEVGNAFINEHPNLVGKCQVWQDLMDDCVLLVAYQYAQNGMTVLVCSDDEFFDRMQTQENRMCAPSGVLRRQ